jgi:hypothetical protein
LRGMGGGGGATIVDEPLPRRSTPPARKEEKHAIASTRVADVPVTDWRSVVRDADRPSVPAAPSTPPTPTVTQAAPVVSSVIPDASHLAERWDELVAAMHTAGKSLAATALGHASPTAVNGRGDVTISLDESNEMYEKALESAKGDLAEMLRGSFPGVQRVIIRAGLSTSTPPVRLTDEMVRAERLTAMRRRDPVLDRAIDALDLDLAD